MDLRYYLMQTLEKQDTVSPKAEMNWQILPRRWVETASASEWKNFE
jgi:hypothetical protein